MSGGRIWKVLTTKPGGMGYKADDQPFHVTFIETNHPQRDSTLRRGP